MIEGDAFPLVFVRRLRLVWNASRFAILLPELDALRRIFGDPVSRLRTSEICDPRRLT